MAIERGNEIPTIDVELITLTMDDGTELALKTASKIAVEPQVTTVEAQKLIVKGILLSQKGEQTTITGHKITMNDNVLNPQLLKIWQGGTIVMDTVDTTKVKKYTPPVNGSTDKGKTFKLNCYSASYASSGVITQYEKISYPNCKGVPVAINSEDNVFRVLEMVLNSAPGTGEAPYDIEYVKTLPVLPTVV